MTQKEHFPEMAFVHGVATPELEVFIQGFLGVLDGEGRRDFRSAQQAQQYRNYLHVNGGTDDIRAKMNGGGRVFVENIFPYDAIMPQGNNHLIHLCLFSNEGALSTAEIEAMITKQYKERSAFIFVHGNPIRTIKDIWHAHVIVDLSNEI